MEVNGKYYPMWGGIIKKKAQFIGGTLEDKDMGMTASTKITNITLTPNGDDSAMFSVEGEDFECAGDVGHLGIIAGEEGWLTFSGYGGHEWRINEPAKEGSDGS